jgi:L-histidine N-alpha-methyltransferase
MNTLTKPIIDEAFKQEVLEGLNSSPKYLSSKYFYDTKGDKLFQDIMALPEYYLTNSEFEIFNLHTQSISEIFSGNKQGFDLFELGAGDGYKTKVLLRYLSKNSFDFTYKPIDISQHAIDQLSESLATELPDVIVDAEKGEYFEVLERLKGYNFRKKVIMILGSNIGNLLHPRAIEFLSKLKETMNHDDLLFMGFDQRKNPQTVLDAYNDSTGVTAAFNKNILERINSELAGDFDLSKFKHWEVYNPETGTAKSYLVATEKQVVNIEALKLTVEFDAWETIHTEISQKYDDKTIQWLANESDLDIVTQFSDSKNYYKNYVFRKKGRH